MRFITLLTPTTTPAGPPPGELLEAIGALGGQATEAGVLVDTAGLAPSAAGARVTMSGGSTTVVDGPFAGTGELGAYAIYQVDSKEQAIEWTKKFLGAHAENWPGWEGEVHVHKVLGPEDFGVPA